MGSFNTSHVTLYQEFDEDDIICALFQYISCYSLSPAWLYFVKFEGSFNTSHVTLYLAAPLATIKYCLVSIHLMLLFILYGYGRMEATTEFQYISCYSLSRKGMGYGTSGMRVSIHLMLLFIRISHFPNIFARIVSIHLMLLFIEKAAVFQMPEDRFQYISCYSLSLAVHTVLQTKPRFNTSHVTLYRKVG